jgi:serine/threonine protein phosphatase PrpC
LRVWLPNQSNFILILDIQGLAMTRSFGDNISKVVGVTHKPEMIKVKIDEKDKFILVASDGVWEFISNQEILQLIAPFYKDKRLEEACDALLKYAYDKWTQGDDSVVDDISFVLVFLHC